MFTYASKLAKVHPAAAPRGAEGAGQTRNSSTSWREPARSAVPPGIWRPLLDLTPLPHEGASVHRAPNNTGEATPASAEVDRVSRLEQFLRDDDEDGAIVLMGQLTRLSRDSRPRAAVRLAGMGSAFPPGCNAW